MHQTRQAVFISKSEKISLEICFYYNSWSENGLAIVKHNVSCSNFLRFVCSLVYCSFKEFLKNIMNSLAPVHVASVLDPVNKVRKSLKSVIFLCFTCVFYFYNCEQHITMFLISLSVWNYIQSTPPPSLHCGICGISELRTLILSSTLLCIIKDSANYILIVVHRKIIYPRLIDCTTGFCAKSQYKSVFVHSA